MKLYYHKTDGGAEYLTDTYIDWEHNGKSGREGTFNAGTRYIVRIDGDITKDAELEDIEENRKIAIPKYYAVIKGKVVYDIESIREEFEAKLLKLK